MQTDVILIVIMVVTGIPIGILIDSIAYKCGLPMQDGMSPVPWALLGLVWPVTLLPFLVYCLRYKNKKEKHKI